MRAKLKQRRIKLGFTQKSIARKLGVSIYTYQYIEQGRSFPREKLFNKLLNVLKIDKNEAFEVFENEDNPNESNSIKRGDVSKNICQYMNSKSNKNYTIHHVNAIRTCILLEYKDRVSKGIEVQSHTKAGKQQILDRVASFVHEKYKFKITSDDVKLYKDSCREEYCYRTGKTTWGIPSVRKKLGFNPTNGYVMR